MIPLFRSIVTSPSILGPHVPSAYHFVVRMAPRAIAASIGAGGGNALTSTFFFGGTPLINRSLAGYSYRTTSPHTTVPNQSRAWPYYLSSVREANNSSSTLSKWAVQPQPALHFVDSTLNLPRCQSTMVQGGLDLAHQQHQDQQRQQRFALKGEDVDDVDASEPLDDRDSLSHHTHHKEETVPLDDRDFDSVHTRHEEDPSVPFDDRDFDSHHSAHHNAASGREMFDGKEKKEEE